MPYQTLVVFFLAASIDCVLLRASAYGQNSTSTSPQSTYNASSSSERIYNASTSSIVTEPLSSGTSSNITPNTDTTDKASPIFISPTSDELLVTILTAPRIACHSMVHWQTFAASSSAGNFESPITTFWGSTTDTQESAAWIAKGQDPYSLYRTDTDVLGTVTTTGIAFELWFLW